MINAAGVEASTISVEENRPGTTSTSALRNILVKPISFSVAKELIMSNHYLGSFPGGTKLAFGVFLEGKLLGVLTLGVGPYNTPSLVAGASSGDYLALTRLWLSDELPRNSESRVLGILLRALKQHTMVKFLISYADPSQGHFGTIYQATGWLYTGRSDPMPLYDMGDGHLRHSRSVANAYGTHSTTYFRNLGIEVKRVQQSAKHRYVHFLDPAWRMRLKVPILPYPKKEDDDASR